MGTKFFSALLLLSVGFYVLHINSNKATLNSISSIQTLSAEILQSKEDPQKSCIFFNGAKRGFFNTAGATSKTIFSAKIAPQDLDPCMTEILADGQSFYKPTQDGNNYCINIHVPPQKCTRSGCYTTSCF